VGQRLRVAGLPVPLGVDSAGIEKAQGVTAMKNLFSEIPRRLHDELLETLVDADSVRIERIVSHGHSSPEGFWYDQQQNEWVAVLKGAATLRFEDDDKLVEMKPGDFLNIPAHRRHRVEWTAPDEPTVWLAVHYQVGSYG
jgi:cupin 2 domain-containing protein